MSSLNIINVSSYYSDKKIMRLFVYIAQEKNTIMYKWGKYVTQKIMLYYNAWSQLITRQSNLENLML